MSLSLVALTVVSLVVGKSAVHNVPPQARQSIPTTSRAAVVASTPTVLAVCLQVYVFAIEASRKEVATVARLENKFRRQVDAPYDAHPGALERQLHDGHLSVFIDMFSNTRVAGITWCREIAIRSCPGGYTTHRTSFRPALETVHRMLHSQTHSRIEQNSQLMTLGRAGATLGLDGCIRHIIERMISLANQDLVDLFTSIVTPAYGGRVYMTLRQTTGHHSGVRATRCLPRIILVTSR